MLYCTTQEYLAEYVAAIPRVQPAITKTNESVMDG